jgi:heptosyltransferase-3
VEILLLHPGALGDIILSLPAVSLLRSRFPSARLTIAGNIDHLAPVATGYAERFLSLATVPLHRLYSCETLSKEEWSFWKSFDKIVSWTGSGNPRFENNLRAIHRDAGIASWKPGPEDPRHVSRIFADSLGLGLDTDGELPLPRIHPDAEMMSKGREWLIARGWNGSEPLAVLHPGAGSTSKRWPLPRFITLARHLALEENKLLIIEGPAEPGLAGEISKELQPAQSIPAASISLSLLAAILTMCMRFIGNDSGIAHLAAALDLPCVVLFGPTLPQHWAPRGPHVAVLRNTRNCEGCASGSEIHTCLGNIEVDEVIRA